MKTDRSSVIINTIGWVFSIVLIIINPPNSGEEYLAWKWLSIFVIFTFWPIQIAYHVALMKGKTAPLLQSFDRGSMMLLITAFFSPTLLDFYNVPGNYIIISVLWGVAIAAMIILLIKTPSPRKLAPIMGFAIGLVGIILILVQFPQDSKILGIFFTLGALFFVAGGAVYAVKKPDPFPDVYGFHEVFHSLLLIGTVFLHVFVFYR